MPKTAPVKASVMLTEVLKNLPNFTLWILLKLAEKLKILPWIYPQLRGQPDLPKLVDTLETEGRKARLPLHCVLVDIENPFVFFHLKPLIRTTKRNFDTMVKKMIDRNKLPENTFVRKKNNLFILLIDRDWIADKFPVA